MKERYKGIDGLKAYAIIGIALMHVLSNGNYDLGGFVFGKLIPSFTNLVFLFMMVSVLVCAAVTTRNLKINKLAWEISTQNDTTKFGLILLCCVCWIL